MSELASCGPAWIERGMSTLREIDPEYVAKSHVILAKLWPHLCSTWADGAFYGDWGAWERLRNSIDRYGVECTGFALREQARWHFPNRCRFGPYSWSNIRRRDRRHHYAQCFQYNAAEFEHP